MTSNNNHPTCLSISLSSQSQQPTLFHQKKQVFYNEQLKSAKLGTMTPEKSNQYQTIPYSRHILTSTRLFSDSDPAYRFFKSKMDENTTLNNITRLANQQKPEDPLKNIRQEKSSNDFVHYMRRVADPKLLSTRKSLGTYQSKHSGTLTLSQR